MQLASVGIHREDESTRDRESVAESAIRAAVELACEMAVFGKAHDAILLGINHVQVAVGTVPDGACSNLLIRSIRRRRPRSREPEVRIIGKNAGFIRIQDLDHSIVGDGHTQLIIGLRTRTQVQLAIAVATGKKNKGAAALRVGHVNSAAAINSNRPWISDQWILKRKQRSAAPVKLVNEIAAGIRYVNVAHSVYGNGHRLIELLPARRRAYPSCRYRKSAWL